MTLDQQISQSKIIQDFVKHPGMILLTEKLNKKIDLKRQAWLNATTPEDAELIRQNGRAYAALMGILNEFLVHGAQAEKALLASKSNDPVLTDDGSKGR